ncbi:MAG TPA: hypothetical protein VJM46_03045 [Candidatus Saccharimonadales bacterium]|nr:hypothetical protein [Candidatus Saccharimonadales bacterium]
MILRKWRPRVFYSGHVVIKSDRVWYVDMRRREASGLFSPMRVQTILGDGESLDRWLRGAGLPSSVDFDGGECMIRPNGRRGRLRAEGRQIVGILRQRFTTHNKLPVRWTWEIRLND